MSSPLSFYVSVNGRDTWSGKLPDPSPSGDDGPFATVIRARNAIRELKRNGELSGPVTVYLRGGRYPIEEPLTFGPEDSGPITYTSFPGERATIDGGRRISGWRIEEVGGKHAWVTDLPEVAAGRAWFQQLFVSGERRVRPRLPKRGFYWIDHVDGIDLGSPLTAQLFEGSDRFRCAPGDVQFWRNLADVEVVVIHYWIEERMPIASFDPETRTVVSSRRSTFVLRDDVGGRFAKYYVENVLEALTEPGEWYLDRVSGRLYYLPLPDEDPATAEVVAGQAVQLLKLAGRPEAGEYVEFLRFEGLDFAHAECDQPIGWAPYFDASAIPKAGNAPHAAAPQAAANVPGAIHLRGARSCAVEGCRILHVGGYGIELSDGCLGNRVIANEIADTGAGGVKLNGADARGGRACRTGNNRVTDNHIHGGGRVFQSAVGVLSIHSFGNVIAHNHIHDLYYSGISCGWVWGYADNVSRDNLIEKNHIHDIGHGLLSDMGGIYTLGVQPGTVIRGNVIHGVEKCNYGGWGIYLDEGSSHIVVEDNLCYDTSSQGFNQHYGRENVVRNNIFAFGHEGQASLTRQETHNSFTFERNILISAGQPFFVGRRIGNLERGGFRSDLNLFWDVSGELVAHVNGRYALDGTWTISDRFSHDTWQGFGQDRHSIVGDPRCRDLDRRDFTVDADSPCLALGFRPIDVSDVGPRPERLL